MTAWLTVVTAVRDDPEGLQRTFASLRTQDLEGVEVLVIDSSADRASVGEVCSDIAVVEWVEPKGVYAAMNLGLQHASGTYVQFLNAGDCLHDDSIFQRVRVASGSAAQWMFGPVEIVESGGSRAITPQWNYSVEQRHLFARGLFPQHQGTFARRDLLHRLGGFDTSFRIAADYAMFLRISQVSDPLQLDFVVADFHAGGLSSQRWQESFREFHRARIEVFHPTGAARMSEWWDYATHFSRVWAYRTVVEPLRRRARR